MVKIKKYFFIFLLLELFFAYGQAYAQQNGTPVYSGVQIQIQNYLCAPTPVNQSQTNVTNAALQTQTNLQQTAATFNSNNGDLYKCINQLYKFAIVIAAVMGVFFIVIAGYVYMGSDGNQESVEKAKSILTSTIASLVILLIGYILLKAINPDLVQFHSIQPPSQPPSVVLQAPTAPTAGGTGQPGGGSLSGGACQPATSGVASVSVLQQSCFGSNANYASMIANKESGGNPSLPSGVDLCRDQNGNVVTFNGQNVAASWGLFQINITANNIVTSSGTLNCPSAFSAVYTSKNHICSVVNPALYQQCITAAADANTNIQTACQMSNNGQNWQPWVYECGSNN